MADGNYNRGAPGPRPDRVQHALNDFRFRLIGSQRLEGGTRPPSLGFNIVKDGLSLNAYTNVQGDEDNGRISATLPLQDVMLLVTLLERADKLQPGEHRELKLAATEFDRNTNGPSQPRLKMTLRIGRNDRGVIYLAVASWKNTRPVITIDMVPSNLLKLFDSQGNQAPADKVSELYSVAWAKSLNQLVPLMLGMHFVPTPPKNPGGQQGGGGGGQSGGQGNRGYGNQNSGGGGYNNNQNNGGSQNRGYQQPPADDSHGGYDDSLPM